MSNEIAIRPKFSLSSRLSLNEITEKVKLALDDTNAPVKGTVLATHIILRIPLAAQHYWSPQLDLDIEETATGSLIKGRFGPRPSVWLLFIFFYSMLAFISLMIMIMGFAQMNLGMSAHILWGLHITGITFLFVFFTAKAGQKLGHAEMIQLKAFLLTTIEVNYENV